MSQSILVIGAGIAGPVLATFLLSSPIEPKPAITILERSSSLRSQGQNVDIRGAGVEVIRKLGLEATIRASLTDEVGVRWVDDKNRVWGEFAADKSGKIQTGTSDIEILRGRLAEICYNKCKLISDELIKSGETGVNLVFGDYVESLDQDADKVHVTFGNSKQRHTYDIVIGADGLLSRTRQLAFGSDIDSASFNDLGIFQGFFSMPKADQDTMWRRWFHTSRRRGVMIRPHEDKTKSTVALYVIPLNDSRFKNVGSKGREAVTAHKALFAEYFADAGWECPRVIREMEMAKDFYASPVAQIHLDCWFKGRVVLLGDAGYCASPISGQGTTLAFLGAYNLAGALARHPSDPKAAFKMYEHEMRPVVTKAQKLALGGKAFHMTNPETWWGVWIMHLIIGFIHYSGIGTLVFQVLGPKDTSDIQLYDYGFRTL